MRLILLSIVLVLLTTAGFAQATTNVLRAKQSKRQSLVQLDSLIRMGSPTGVKQMRSDIEPYGYDTLLSHGYHLAYRVHLDSAAAEGLQSLTLVKGKREIRQLNEISYPLPQKNLGYIGADFGDTFLFVQSYGAGNPHEMQLIEKKTGKERMQGVWVDVHQAQKVVLYIANIHEENETLKLLDLKSGKEIIISDFQDSVCAQERISGLRDCVKIASVTAKEIILKVDDDAEILSKKYKR